MLTQQRVPSSVGRSGARRGHISPQGSQGQGQPDARITRMHVQGLEAAQRAQKEEERQAREQQAQRQAQAAEDEHVAQLLDAVSKATRQDVTDLDRAAVIADSAAGPTFECPLLFIECDKVRPPPLQVLQGQHYYT